MKVDIKHLEDLSQLSLADGERERFSKDISKMLEFVDQITKLDIALQKKEPMELKDLREDKVVEEEGFDPLLNAPETKDGCYLTPLVVE